MKEPKIGYFINSEGDKVSFPSHPYGFDLIFEREGKITGSVYSDRLYQWDSEKFNNLCQKHFGNESQYFYNRSPKKIEEFLCDYLDELIKIIRISKTEHKAHGNPIWFFEFQEFS